jgi:hypothetical protein
MGIAVASGRAMNAWLHFPLLELPVVFAVVGEHRDDPTCLLLLGEDGQHDAYRLLDGAVLAIEPDDAWRVDGARPPLDALTG